MNAVSYKISKFVTVLEISRKEAKTAAGGSGFVYSQEKMTVYNCLEMMKNVEKALLNYLTDNLEAK